MKIVAEYIWSDGTAPTQKLRSKTKIFEKGLEDLTPALAAMGHQVRSGGAQGDAHSILIRDGKKYPGVDHRMRGGAAGY